MQRGIYDPLSRYVVWETAGERGYVKAQQTPIARKSA